MELIIRITNEMIEFIECQSLIKFFTCKEIFKKFEMKRLYKDSPEYQCLKKFVVINERSMKLWWYSRISKFIDIDVQSNFVRLKEIMQSIK